MFHKAPIVLPKLRFKGFDGEWEDKRIVDSFYFINGLSGLDRSNFFQGKDSYLEYIEIYKFKKLYNINGKYFDLKNSKQNTINKNDILITSTSETPLEIGISSIYLGDTIKYLNSFCFAIRSKLESINPEYINILLSNKNYRKDIIKICNGSTRYNMSKNEFGKLLIKFPSLPEQTKIAYFFSLLDKQIELWENKLQLVELIKKRMVDTILVLKTNLAKLRFKGFDGEWEEKSLKEIAYSKRAISLSKQDLNIHGTFPCILYGEIFTTYKKPIVNINQIISYTNKNIISKSKGNEIIFPTSSTSLKDFFPSVCVKKPEIYLGGDIAIFYINDLNDSMFFHYLFSTSKHLRNMFRLAEGSTINHLYLSYIESYKFYYTSSLQEQTKISYFFSLYDKLLQKINKVIVINKQNKIHYLKTLFL